MEDKKEIKKEDRAEEEKAKKRKRGENGETEEEVEGDTWGCEFDCGYRGVLVQVQAHEKVCIGSGRSAGVEWGNETCEARQYLVPQAFTHWTFEHTLAECDETLMVYICIYIYLYMYMYM